MSTSRRLLLEWAEFQGRDCLRVSGWTDSELRELGRLDAGELNRRLALFPGEALEAGRGRPATPPIAGRLTIEQDRVCFMPRFPFVDGMGYSLLVDANGSGEMVETWAIQRTPAAAIPTTEVLGIYPNSSTLPYNLLRMYVYFSSPMSEGWAGRAIKICREDTGVPLDDVFLPPEPELWDPERRRLTMLLDPGRIKRGLVPNREFGYPLAEGMRVRITVGAEFRDAKGLPLKADAARSYLVGPDLRSRIDPTRWRLNTPTAGSRDPLVVDFDRPLDHGLLQHSLWVSDDAGNRLTGTGEPCAEQCGWRFTPSIPWRPGEHRLMVEPRLEDVAGNSPVRVFDRDVSKAEDTPAPEGRAVVNFACGTD